MTIHSGLVRLTALWFFPFRRNDQDLLQCGLIGLWAAAESWREEGKFEPYAKRCILNRMTDYLRAEKRAAPVAEQWRQAAAPAREEDALGRVELVSSIEKVWPANSRERYVLIALLSGVSKQSIAAALGVQLHTVRRIAEKALAGLEEAH